MSELLATLNNPSAAKEAESWEAEVAKAGEAEQKPVEEKPAETPVVSHETIEEAPAQAEQPAIVAEPKEDKQVPLKALREEREARKALERKLADLEQRLSQPVQPVEEPEAPPDPEVDPIGALKYQMAQQATLQEQQRAQNYQQALLTGYQGAMRSYLETEPAFMDAYQYALKSRASELRALGTPEVEIDPALKLEQLQIADSAFRQGRNPAEVIFKFAEARGFLKKAPEQKPAPAAKVDPAVQQAKADAATSLTSGGKPPANDLTDEEALRTLKGAAYDSWAEKKWKAMEQAGGRKSSLFPN